MPVTMRAKFMVTKTEDIAVVLNSGESEKCSEKVAFSAVGGTAVEKGPYPDDGSDEDNTYARWTPAGELSIQIQNPALFGKFTYGQKFYLDFTEAED